MGVGPPQSACRSLVANNRRWRWLKARVVSVTEKAAGARLRSQRLDAHPPHQPPHALAVDRKALFAQRPRDPPRAVKRPRGEQRVDATHRLQIVVVGRSRLAATPGAVATVLATTS